MPHYFKIILAALLTVLALPATGHARIVEMGQTDTEFAPSCPEKPCLAVSRTTGWQKRVDGNRSLYVVPADGRIVAWTVALGAPTEDQVEFFDERLGGEPTAGITVFRMSKKKKERGIGTSIGESGLQKLTDYLGKTVQFPMANTIRVKKGDRVALTVPTWAPVLADELPLQTAWRATRSEDDCDDTTSQTAIQELGTATMFGCGYRGAQLTYTATLITAPRKPRKPRGGGDNDDARSSASAASLGTGLR